KKSLSLETIYWKMLENFCFKLKEGLSIDIFEFLLGLESENKKSLISQSVSFVEMIAFGFFDHF
ncbi:MAG TPA: hypothetical protein VNK03_04675, partial [Gammaproteobacteria bacterium]|nr:hypothetical protein [Gammaproteobacteria bacterium]